MLKQKIIGTFAMGFEDVQLVLREGTGGEFYNCPGKGLCPSIKVGGDVPKWENVCSALLHEAMELRLNRSRARYDPSYDMGDDHSAYLFVFDHPTFSDCCAQVAEFLTLSMPPLATAWRKWGK